MHGLVRKPIRHVVCIVTEKPYWGVSIKICMYVCMYVCIVLLVGLVTAVAAIGNCCCFSLLLFCDTSVATSAVHCWLL